MFQGEWFQGFKVSVRVVGKLLPPCSFSCFCHFSCQVFSSLSKHSGDGKSFLYRSHTGHKQL